MDTNNIVKYWPVITAVLATTVAFGMSFQKIESLEQAMVKQVIQDKKIEKVMIQQSASDARQEMIIQMLKDIKLEIKK